MKAIVSKIGGLWVLGISGLLIISIGGGLWFVQQQDQDELSNESTTTNLAQDTSQEPTGNDVSSDNTFMYTNDDFQFQLEFPQSWNGATELKVASAPLFQNEPELGRIAIIDFEFFTIGIYDQNQWKVLENRLPTQPKPVYLGENEFGVFAYSIGDTLDNGVLSVEREEIMSIIDTFTIIE